MLEGVTDNAGQPVRRHRASLERLRDGLAPLLESLSLAELGDVGSTGLRYDNPNMARPQI